MDTRSDIEIENGLAQEWFKLWSQILPGASLGSLPQEEWQKLITRYCEPHRAYHTLRHIDYVLGMLRKYGHLAEDPVALAYAAFRHDELYFAGWRPTGLPGNEALSAAAADEPLAKAYKLGSPICTPEFRTRVYRLTMVTLHDPEKYEPTTRDEMLMVDIDWSAIGFPHPQFVIQRAQVRTEYSDYSDEEFRQGSIAFFKKASARPRQFYLPEFSDKYEHQALQNIEYALKKLESGAIA